MYFVQPLIVQKKRDLTKKNGQDRVKSGPHMEQKGKKWTKKC